MDDRDENDDERVIVHFDLDAFYVACERELNEALRNVPVAVSQYNPYGDLKEKASHEIHKRLVVCPLNTAEAASRKRKYPDNSSQQSQQLQSSTNYNNDANGSLIAVSYEARAAGVKRNDRGVEAVRKCPALSIVQVPVKHGKADLTLYRTSSSRVMDVLTNAMEKQSKRILDNVDGDDSDGGSGSVTKTASSFVPLPVEVASIDEVYVDVTKPAGEMVRQILKQQQQQQYQRQLHQHSSSCDSSLAPRNHDSNYDTNLTWEEIVREGSKCTTIGGIEQLSDAALAANALNKDEIRRGSRFQVLDSSKQQTHDAVDEGSQSWWQRRLHRVSTPTLNSNENNHSSSSSFSSWTPTELRLAVGAYLASQARKAVLQHFEGGVYTLSAGISSNKTLAKLASGLKKPNRQTLINRMDDKGALTTLFHPLPLGRIRGLGGKFGDHVSNLLSISTVGQLATIPLPTLISTFGTEESSSLWSGGSSTDLSSHHKTARFLYDIARGICHEEVTPRTMPKSIACGKTFRGKLAMASSNVSELQKWTKELCSSLIERLIVDREQYNRFPTTLCVSIKVSKHKNSSSKQARAPKQLEYLEDAAFQLILQLIGTARSRQKQNDDHGKKVEHHHNIMVEGLTVSVSQFVEMAAGSSSIMAAFERSASSSSSQTTGPNKSMNVNNSTSNLHRIRKIATAMVKKKSSMDQWLNTDTKKLTNGHEDKSDAEHDSNRDNVMRSRTSDMGPNTVRTRQKPIGGMRVFLNSTSRTSVLPSTIQNTKPSAQTSASSTPVILPTLEEIDPAVFNELPEDLRQSLVKDIGNQQKWIKKTPPRTNIQKYFDRPK